MNPYRLPMAFIAFFGIAAVTPAWMFFLNEYSGEMPTETAWLAAFTLPAVALLFVASWLGGDIREA